MNTYSFQFASKYTGNWRLPAVDGDVYGELLLYEHSISLELLSTKEIDFRTRSPIQISGIAQAEDNKNYRFILIGARLGSWSHTVLTRSVFEIDEIILCEGVFSPHELITGINIRTVFADNWLSRQLVKSFIYGDNHNSPGEVQLCFKPQGNVPLCDFDDFLISFYLGYSNLFELSSVTLSSDAFINVEYKKDGVSQVEAEKTADRIVHFFALIWNVIFEPDYVTYYTQSTQFIKKVSDRVSYRYIEKKSSNGTYTAFEDFSDFKKIGEMMMNWLAFYEEFEPALSAYFEVISNKRNPPSLVLRTFIFVLETLAKNCCTEQAPLPEDNKRRVLLKTIADKYKISSSDWKELEEMFLMEKKGTTKSKIKALVDEVKIFLPSSIDDSFITKAVNTRHNITHGGKYNKVSFAKDEFRIVNFRLSQIIRAYLLYKIEAPKIVYSKIIQYSN